MLSWGNRGSKAQVAPSSEGDSAEMSTRGPYGLEVCHEGDQAVADIIFVHGLTGNRYNTWTSKTEKIFWPKDLLPQDLKNTRIMTYGYDADIAHFWTMASQNRIGEHAGNLVNAVAQVRDRTDTEKRPIIFVTHSLGGLVTEDALLFSKNSAEPHLQDLVRSVVGICFLGTPHCGSDLARWGSIMGSLVNAIKTANVDLVNVLRTDSEVLARVQREFHTMLRGPSFKNRPPLEITCFFEELPVRGAIEIVPKHSAILSSYNAIGIRQNHMDMTKFTGANDGGYLSVSGELRRWVKAIANQAAKVQPQQQSANAYAEYMERPPPQPTEHSQYHDQQQRGWISPPTQDPGYYPPYVGNQQSPPPGYQSGHARSPNPYGQAPMYQQYRPERAYASPPPPPEPRFFDETPSMSSLPTHSPYAYHNSTYSPESRWGQRSPPSQQQQPWSPPVPDPRWSSPPHQESSFHQGGHTISGQTQTYEGGKTVQGMNVNAGGDVNF